MLRCLCPRGLVAATALDGVFSSLYSTANHEIDAAQKELDEFFGTSNPPDMGGGLLQEGFTHVRTQASQKSPPCAQSSSLSTVNQAELSHVDDSGRASMVDVAQKNSTCRVARASAVVEIGAAAFQLVKNNALKKGDVLSTAQIAGIMAAKQTSSLIPLCHNIVLSKADVRLRLMSETCTVQVSSEVRTIGQTGVEMEALTAASVAALTVYDMCKSVTKDIVIRDVQLDFKSGGKSGDYSRK